MNHNYLNEIFTQNSQDCLLNALQELGAGNFKYYERLTYHQQLNATHESRFLFILFF